MIAKILIVDADRQAAAVLMNRLKDHEIQAEAVFSAQDAFIKAGQLNYDAVIMDLMTPKGNEVDGITALAILKEKNPDLQIILLTAHANMENSLDAFKRGAFDLIKKPIDIRSLVETIFEAAAQKKIHAQKRIQQEKQARLEAPVGEAKRVRDLMIPHEAYAAVFHEATIFEAVLSLEDAQKNVDQGHDQHRNVLVLNNEHEVVGMLSPLDILCALESKYDNLNNLLKNSSDGLGPEFIQSMMADVDPWRKPLQDICKKAAGLKILDIMHTPKESEYVKADDSIDHAINQLVMGRHQSLLVTDAQDKIIGVLNLQDLFESICNKIKACGI
jgi:DNA-binding response OmpR family regulator